jgi:hypothetical protein
LPARGNFYPSSDIKIISPGFGKVIPTKEQGSRVRGAKGSRHIKASGFALKRFSVFPKFVGLENSPRTLVLKGGVDLLYGLGNNAGINSEGIKKHL